MTLEPLSVTSGTAPAQDQLVHNDQSTSRVVPVAGRVTPYQPIGVVHSTWFGHLLMILSNTLTLLRALLSPFVYILIVLDQPSLAILAYSVGLITDFFDGVIARTFDSACPFGRAMDSTADKMLVFSGMLGLERVGLLPAWMVLAFTLREFLTFGLRSIRMSSGEDVGGINHQLGRIRFFVLHVGILMLLLATSPRPDWLAPIGFWVVTTAIVISWFALAFYVQRDRDLLRSSMTK